MNAEELRVMHIVGQWDQELFLALNMGWSHPLWDLWNGVLSHKVLWLLIFSVLAFLGFWRGGMRGRVMTLMVMSSAAVTYLANHHLLKQSIQRPRPCQVFSLEAQDSASFSTSPYWGAAAGSGSMQGDVVRDERLARNPAGCHSLWGMPSSHSAFFAAAATAAALLSAYRLAGFFAFSAFLVGLARVVLGVHYPGDVVVGWLVGAVISWVMMLVMMRIPPVRRALYTENTTPEAAIL